MANISTGAEDYVLGRDMYGSVRLDAQHLLWKLHNGYTLNPRIPISPNMKIAEIGTGTGIWLLDLADQLPQTVQLDGYDISDSQYPSQDALASNMSLRVLDSFGDVPPHLTGKYDVVHLRFWCCVVKGNDPSLLIRHAMNLLKPGGYIQWEDAHLGRRQIKGQISEEFGHIAQTIFKAGNIFFDWLGEIDKHAQRMGLDVIDYKTDAFRPSLIPLCTNTYLMGHVELFQVIAKLRSQQFAIPSEMECRKLLLDLFRETKKGEVYHWFPVTFLATKPVSTI